MALTIITIPKSDVAYIANLIIPNRVIIAVVPDFKIGEWEHSLGEILELEFNVAEERQFIGDLRIAIVAEFQKGTVFMEILQAVKLSMYAHWAGYDQWLEMNTLRLMTDLWKAPFPRAINAK